MTKKSTEQHQQRVMTVSNQVRMFFERRQKVRIFRGATNSTRPQHFKAGEVVDVSGLNQILEVNLSKGYAWVEPNVPMDQLVSKLLKYGARPKVVPEFPGITVGGAVQGGAGESSSFKWGGFHDCCLAYEIVIGDGSVMTVSSTENPDLFYGTSCSYGTLGVLTCIKLEIMPVQPLVELTYHPVDSPAQAVKMIVGFTKNDNLDFIDAILFSKTDGVVMTGVCVTKSSLPRQRFIRATDEWFYLHASKIANRKVQITEQIPLTDYFFRYDRGAFWMGKYFFGFLRIPFNRLSRFLCDRMMRTRMLYRMLHAANASQKAITQDICLPTNNVEQFLEFVDQATGIYPIWLCPGQFSKTGKDRLSPGALGSRDGINVGVWGRYRAPFGQFLEMNRKLENVTSELGGRKVLYAHAYYTKAEFWQIYNQDWYQKLRQKYKAEVVFPDIYDKVIVKDRLIPSKKGILRALWKSPFKL